MTTARRMNIRYILVLSFTFISILGSASVGLGTNPAVNLWSLQYLWAQATPALLPRQLLITSPSMQPPQGHISGFVWLARQALATGSPLQAQQLLQPALAMGSTDADRLYAQILYQQGYYQQAIDLLKQQGAIDLLLVAGHHAADAKENTIALAAYEAAYMVAPEQTVLFLAHFLWSSEITENSEEALLGEEAGRAGVAQQRVRPLGEQSAAAELLLQQYIRKYPSSRQLFAWLNELGKLYQKHRVWGKAAVIYEQLLEAAPDQLPARINLGWVYYERGDGVDAAVAQFQQVVKNNPHKGTGDFAIAQVLTAERQWQSAETWYASALQKEPNQRWWWLARGQNALHVNDVALTVSIYAMAQKWFPNDAVTQIQAATAYQKNNDVQRALQAVELAKANFDRTLPIQTATDRLRNSNYLVRMGDIYNWAGNGSAATRLYERALQLDPQRPDIQKKLETLYGN